MQNKSNEGVRGWGTEAGVYLALVRPCPRPPRSPVLPCPHSSVPAPTSFVRACPCPPVRARTALVCACPRTFPCACAALVRACPHPFVRARAIVCAHAVLVRPCTVLVCARAVLVCARCAALGCACPRPFPLVPPLFVRAWSCRRSYVPVVVFRARAALVRDSCTPIVVVCKPFIVSI